MITIHEEITIHETAIDNQPLPRVWEVKTSDQSVDQLCAWITTQTEKIDQIVNQDGALLIRGLHALKTAEDFQQVLDVLSPQLMEYIGGTSPRKVVTGNIVTATELPAEYSIPLHQEMSYTDNAPSRVVFFCQKPAEARGFTTIADMRKLTQDIKPEVASRFEHGGIQLRRTLPADTAMDKKPGIAKPWSEVFNTTDPQKVDQIVAEKGWCTHWLDDGSVQLWQEVRPAKKRDTITQDEVWFNQAHIFAQATTLRWARKDHRHQQLERLENAITQHPEMMDQVFHRDGSPIADDDVLHIFDVMEAHEIPIALNASDILLLNNTLVAHGRTSYRGERQLLAALIP